MLVLWIHVAATWLMLGLIWTVQLVHYPLMRHVAPASWGHFHRAHCQRITRIVAPAMLIELGTAVLLFLAPPPSVPMWTLVVGGGLLVAVWGTTAFVSVPLHDRMRDGFEAPCHARLVQTNWLRTAAWSGRGIIVLAMLAA